MQMLEIKNITNEVAKS